jgi:ribosome biogenesis protein UTP30
MAKGQLIDSHVSLDQCKLAVEALHSNQTKLLEKKAETELLPGKDQHIWLVLAVKKIHPENKLKPFKMCVSKALLVGQR